MRLKNKCQIGRTVFNKGIDYETVIARAEREYIRNHQCVECKSIDKLVKLFSGDLMCLECAECSGLT